MRKALIVGIDDYASSPLTGCVNDAIRMESALRVNGDGSANFTPHTITSSASTQVTKPLLRGEIEQLFSGESDVEVALFYFSGHGLVTAAGGMIVTQDAQRHDEGISLNDIVTIANNSHVRNKIIILDCCYSGAAGNATIAGGTASVVGKGITIMTASRDSELADEIEGEGGIFTSYIIEGLDGGAADTRGFITPASLYSYVDEAMGAWEQRPVFKSNISEFIHLRQVEASVSDVILRKLPEYFDDPTSGYTLSPDHEPDSETPDPIKNAIFKELQILNRAALVVPVGADHMYYAAMESKSCKLTAFGAQYWRMAKKNRI
jgi:hypothetical protein